MIAAVHWYHMVLDVISVALILGLWRIRMNTQEQDAVHRLEQEIGRLNTSHEAQRAQISELQTKAAGLDIANTALVAANASLETQVSDLQAQLTAATATPDGSAEINALTDSVDAELAKDAPAAPPAADPAPVAAAPSADPTPATVADPAPVVAPPTDTAPAPVADPAPATSPDAPAAS